MVMLCCVAQFRNCHSIGVSRLEDARKNFNSFYQPEPPFHFVVELMPPWMLGTRVGEATKPGPLRVALVNPTSVVSKISQFDCLANNHCVDIVCASETSATEKAQKSFTHQARSVCGYKSIWSPPVLNQFDRLDGTSSMRGRASGVCTFSRLPCRHALHTISDDLMATSRLVHSIHTCGELQFQVVTIYGLACHSTQADSQTDQLVRAALTATEHMMLPTIIAGDFNCDPFSLECSLIIRQRHLDDLPSLHRKMYGRTMAPTCRDVTWPDNALLCPQMASWLSSIEVLDDPLFDTHKVVIFSMDMPTQNSHLSRLVLPQSWIEYPIDSAHIAQQYDSLLDTPRSLEAWASKVETAVDLAYQQTQLDQGVSFAQIKSLPKRAKGRCRPRRPQLMPIRALLPKSRPGEFVPKFEIHRFSTLKMIKQLRRIQALRRRVAKLVSGGSDKGLNAEWWSILHAATPAGGFVAWCCSLPEVGPPPRACPSLEFLHTCEQLLRYQVDQDVAFDHQCWVKKLEYARFLDAQDQGHARACARLRNKDTPPLTELKECIREECSIVMEDQTNIWAYCDNPLQFIRQAPVHLDGSVCHIKALDNYGILLHPVDSDREWPEEGLATQDQVLTRPQDIVERLNKFWMPYWAHPDSSTDMSSEFQVFLDALPELHSPFVKCTDPELWQSAVKSLKPHSARGVDGISAAELQSLPATAILQLASILCSFRGGFPAWLMVARTFAVPKCSTTPRSADIRPITVLSQVYRLWARVICSQLLAHYSPLLPPEIWGLLRGRGPFSASYQLQWWLEKLAFQKVSNAGLVLDLVKCFNSIHRPTVFAILGRLGVPGDILDQWSKSLALLTRSWSLQGYDGQLTECVHGFPEGDVFSVLAMIGVALSWTSYLKEQCPASLIGAYADNWCLASIYKADFVILIKSTILFVRLLCMAIDWKKTWIWSTHKSLLLALKHALSSQLPSLSVERLTTAMDLGAQMTYSGPPRLGKFRNRLSHFKTRCHLLQSLPHDVYTKAHLARTAILPTLYGVALLPLGEAHSAAMRTQLVNAILGYNHSRSSLIAMQYLPCVYDPGLWIILQAIEAARRYLAQATPVDASTFCHILSLHDGASSNCRGPVGCLKHYLLRLGWTVSKEGLVHVSPFVSLSLFTAGKQSWVFWANMTWQQDILLHTGRKAIHGNYAVNLGDTRAILHRLPANKCARIIQEISGAFQTAGQKQKWDQNATDLCQFCPAVDSRYHRIYDCPATAHIRLEHKEVIDFFRFHNDQMHEFPVLIADPQMELLHTIHWTQPVASFDEGLIATVQALIDQEYIPSFYTDGSCQFPELPTVRFASFSVVLDLCLSNDEREAAARGFQLTGVTPTSLKTILVSRTQGLQKISRSELLAVVLIAENFPAAHIYSDSQSTIDRLNLCRSNRDPLCVLDSDDSDLLLRLQVALTDRHFIYKVAAHVDPSYSTNMLQCYHLLGNSVANDSAIKSCWFLHEWLVKSCQAKCLEIRRFRHFLAKWYDFLLELQQHCATLMSNRQ